MKKVICRSIIAALMLCAVVCAAPLGQGKIKGRVVDATGNAVPNLPIIVVNRDTQTHSSTTTDQTGTFLIAELQPGKYFIQAQTGNVQAAQTLQPDTNVEADSTTTVDLQRTDTGTLEVKTETIAPDINTAPIQTVYNSTQIELLPQPNAISRSGEYYGAYNLSLLSEGVTQGTVLQNGVGPSVGGRPVTSNNYHLQGTDNNNQLVPGPLVKVSNEATSEFTMLQAQQTPQYGHASGGNMNIFVRDGSNAWHGGAYEYLNNRKLNAREPGVSTFGRNFRYDQSRMGGKAGGPIVHDSVTGFFDFEYAPLRSDQFVFGQALAPTAQGIATLSTIPGVSTTNLNALRNTVTVDNTVAGTTTVNGVTIPLGLVNPR